MTGTTAATTSLIIGGGGFVGPYLAAELLTRPGCSVHATLLPSETIECDGVITHALDVRDQSAVTELLHQLQPAEVFHLAAQSSVAASWRSPDMTIDINIRGALHVLEAARLAKSKPRVLLVGSSEEYGATASHLPVLHEDDPVRPMNVYAMTKDAQNKLGTMYWTAYQVPVVMVRAFNHIGPGQSDQFVVSDFCHQVAMIESGLQPLAIHVGNLSAARDFTDVRDIVHAYRLLASQGVSGETYNVGSGQAVQISALLDQVLAMSPAAINVDVDQSKYRPVDVQTSCADVTKIEHTCGWRPSIPLTQTLTDTLNWWRQRVAQEAA